MVDMAETVKGMKGPNDQKTQNQRNCFHSVFSHVINSKWRKKPQTQTAKTVDKAIFVKNILEKDDESHNICSRLSGLDVVIAVDSVLILEREIALQIWLFN